MRDVGIIGAGASGLMAALMAGKRGLSVTVFEKKEQPGKKLMVTGNGRCNFSNRRMDESCYYSSDPAFTKRFLSRFSANDAVSLFAGLGMLTEDRNGYLYPASAQASSVVSVLTEAVKAYDVEIKSNSPVTAIQHDKNGFTVFCGGERFSFSSCILCCGSPAGVKDKLPFNAYQMLEELGHKVNKPLPALVKLTGNEGFEKAWAGVRTKVSVSFQDQCHTGEIQLTDTGISGIPVFQLSHEAVRRLDDKQTVVIKIDFLPDYTEETLSVLLSQKSSSEETGTYLRGWLPSKLISVILKKTDIRSYRALSSLKAAEKQQLIHEIKLFSYPVTGHGGFMDAQSVSGGVPLSEVSGNFESRLVKNLYITGELLDMDGLCGGYNLHFAFGSGKIAGEHVKGIDR